MRAVCQVGDCVFKFWLALQLPGLLAGAEGLDHGARSEPKHNPEKGLKKEPEDVVSEGTGVGAAAMGNRRCSNTRG